MLRLSHQTRETPEGMYIEMILEILGLSEKDMLEDSFYLRELEIRPYAIDTLVNLLMRKKLLLVINGKDDYKILRPYAEGDRRTQLDALIEYYMLLCSRYGKPAIGRDALVGDQIRHILN